MTATSRELVYIYHYTLWCMVCQEGSAVWLCDLRTSSLNPNKHGPIAFEIDREKSNDSISEGRRHSYVRVIGSLPQDEVSDVCAQDFLAI